MSDNKQYTNEKHGTFTPVGVILVVAIVVLVGVFLYGRFGGGAGSGASTPAATTVDGTNPNQLVPAPLDGQSRSNP